MLTQLTPRLTRDAVQDSRSSVVFIEPDVYLAITLLFLAGVSYLDQILMFRVGKSTVYCVFHGAFGAFLNDLPMPGVPMSDTGALRVLTEKFSLFRALPSLLYGSISALNCFDIAVQKP